jgi:hypothetical protein
MRPSTAARFRSGEGSGCRQIRNVLIAHVNNLSSPCFTQPHGNTSLSENCDTAHVVEAGGHQAARDGQSRRQDYGSFRFSP